jgi:L-seryl-tRNA(Ser) seleniumtransferase
VRGERAARQTLEAGAAAVTFSGDKLLGGPQAGLVAGRADLVARMRRDPLARAMRPDKTTLAAMAATLAVYRAGRAVMDIPVWRAIGTDLASLRERADRLLVDLAADGVGGDVAVVECLSAVGGGALPGQTLPSVALRLGRRRPSGLARTLRMGTPSVVARIEDDAVLVDLRTVDPSSDKVLGGALASALESMGS